MELTAARIFLPALCIFSLASVLFFSSYTYKNENPGKWPRNKLKPIRKDGQPMANNSSRKFIIVSAYMHSGSSILATLFSQKSKSFFYYEPFQSIYHSIFNFPIMGHPLAITHHLNTTIRRRPLEETEMHEHYMLQMSNCNMSALPSQMCKYLEHNGQKMKCPYCTNTRGVGIHQMLPSYTPKGKILRTKQCIPEAKPSRVVTRPKRGLCSCNWYETAATLCEKSTMLVTKVLRVNIEELLYLLERNENYHVVHQVRDPRAMLYSHIVDLRNPREATVALYSKKFCDLMRHNLEILKNVLSQYPQRLVLTRYEDFVDNPVAYVNAIYQKLGLDLDDHLRKWVNGVTSARRDTGRLIRRDPKQSSVKWKARLKKNYLNVVNQYCQDLYEYFNSDKNKLFMHVG